MRSRGDEVNSVKYPQLDATHWHTVSMQILFTLALLPLCLSPSCSPYLALSLSLSPFRYRDPRRERERERESLSAPSSFALLFRRCLSRGKRSDAPRVHTPRLHHAYTRPPPPSRPLPLPVSRTLPRNRITLFIPISSSLLARNECFSGAFCRNVTFFAKP